MHLLECIVYSLCELRMRNGRRTVRCRRLWPSIHLVYTESLLKMVGQVWKGRDIYVDCPIYPWTGSWLLHWTQHWLGSEDWCAAWCLGEATCACYSEGSRRNWNIETHKLMNFNTLSFDKKIEKKSSIGTVTGLHTGWPRNWGLVTAGTREYCCLQRCRKGLCVLPSPSIQWVLGSLLPGIKLPLHHDCSFLPSTKVKNVRSYTSVLPVCFYNMQRDNFSFVTSWFWFRIIFIISKQLTTDDINLYLKKCII